MIIIYLEANSKGETMVLLKMYVRTFETPCKQDYFCLRNLLKVKHPLCNLF